MNSMKVESERNVLNLKRKAESDDQIRRTRDFERKKAEGNSLSEQTTHNLSLLSKIECDALQE